MAVSETPALQEIASVEIQVPVRLRLKMTDGSVRIVDAAEFLTHVLHTVQMIQNHMTQE